MDISDFSKLVSDISAGGDKDVDEIYSKLMSTEQNTLRVVERVASDQRTKALHAANAWEMSLAAFAREFAQFWASVYMAVMEGKLEKARSKLSSPDGYFYSGTMILLLMLVFLVIVAA